MVLSEACPIDAEVVEGIVTLHIVGRAYRFVAFRAEIATLARVPLPANPICAEQLGCIDLVHILGGTRVGVAMTFFNATNMEVGLLAVCVFAEDTISVVPVLEARRACVSITFSLGRTTGEPLVVHASSALACEGGGSCLDDEARWATITRARGHRVAARVPVNMCAPISLLAIELLGAILVDKTVGAFVGVALALWRATHRKLCVAAILIAAEQVLILLVEITLWALVRVAMSLCNATHLVIFTCAIPVVAHKIGVVKPQR
jgi:hypothetical protein